MAKIIVRRENQNARERGYGIYVNAYVSHFDDEGDVPLLYASECVDFSRQNDESYLKAAERRVKAKARRILKKELE